MSKHSRGSAIEIVVFGVVQGVGFRPFVYRNAKKLGYKGWVKNIGYGVKIHLEKNEKTDFSDLLQIFKKDLPPLAQIENTRTQTAPFLECEDFIIERSEGKESFVFISPDISVCGPCYEELMEPKDRRYHYPFINCTDCGPRYTIVKELPYDRPQTTMKKFKMCPECHQEYIHPMDRRYHAQPIACPVCGPHIMLIEAKSGKTLQGGMKEARSFLEKGKILAVKGLGGFHLVCSPFKQEAVQHLRQIKSRQTKPLALMARDLDTIKKYAMLNPEEKEHLLSPRRPIVLLKKKKDIKGISPHLDEMGFMLPYTPLHFLLLENADMVVATSSNKKDAPIMKDEQEGIYELCDIVLTHDRPIQTKADDSVMKIVNKRPVFLRRARGYVPYPQRVPARFMTDKHILALGAELKDTVSVYKNGYIITSQFLGDLDEYQNFQYFEDTIDHLTRLFKVTPNLVVSDLHPDFHTTRYAEKSRLPYLQVQHHFAHVLAGLLEHDHPQDKKVIGVSFDGYGYGADGTAWGGEFLLADYTQFDRFAHFESVHLPGGDLAAKQPWRMALSYLFHVFGEDLPPVESLKGIDKEKIKGLVQMMRQDVNSPKTSSCGRLFDAVSYLIGIAPSEVEFEAEAPMRLESIAETGRTDSYAFSLHRSEKHYIVTFQKMIRAILDDLKNKTSPGVISSKFHTTLAKTIVSVAKKAQREQEVETVVLTGGVFLNGALLSCTEDLLAEEGFRVLRPTQYSPNDESISVGQIAYALAIQDHSKGSNLI